MIIFDRLNANAWIAAFALPLVTYVATICPTVYGLDSPELTTAASLLGISHPPGHPLFALLGKLATLFPFGDIALRASLLSAICGAIAVLLLYKVLRRFAPALVALPLALAFAASHAVWFQSVRAEVYTLHAALALGIVAIATAPTTLWRAILAAPLLLGLALGNHHYLVIVIVPGVVALLVYRHGAVTTRAFVAARPLACAITFALIGLAVYVYLPLRAGQTAIDWGRPDTASRFAWTVSAELFQKAASAPKGSLFEGTARAFEILGDDLGGALVTVGLFAIVVLLCVRSHRALGVALTLLILGAVFPKAQMGFASTNPDDHGYLIVALVPLLLAIAAAIGVAKTRVLPVLRPSLRLAAVAAAAVLLVASTALVAVESATRSDGRKRRGADTIAREEMKSLPEGAFLFSSYFKTEFILGFLQEVERARPDVTIVHRHALTLPGVREGLARLAADGRAFVDAYLGGDLVGGANRLAERRPLFWEIDYNMPESVVPHLMPRGFFAAWGRAPTTDDTRAVGRAEAVFFAILRDRIDGAIRTDTEDIETVFWVHYLRGRFWRARGERDLAVAAFDRALAIDPNNAEVRNERREAIGAK